MSNPADTWEMPDTDPEAPASKPPPSKDVKRPADDGAEVTGARTTTDADGKRHVSFIP